ncbi:hypothetical protein Bca101_099791 [Brassica carinata]
MEEVVKAIISKRAPTVYSEPTPLGPLLVECRKVSASPPHLIDAGDLTIGSLDQTGASSLRHSSPSTIFGPLKPESLNRRGEISSIVVNRRTPTRGITCIFTPSAGTLPSPPTNKPSTETAKPNAYRRKRLL